jgi:hypothetical protein
LGSLSGDRRGDSADWAEQIERMGTIDKVTLLTPGGKGPM